MTTPYRPSEAAKKAFYRALETMAMRTYHELTTVERKHSYAIGFTMGYDGLPFPVEAVQDRAMDDGFMFGARASHRGYKQHESAPVVYYKGEQ